MFSLVAHNLISVNEKQKSSGLRTLPKLLNSTFYSRSYSAAAAKSLQSCPTPRDPGSPPGSAVPGILQAKPLEWVAISFSNA